MQKILTILLSIICFTNYIFSQKNQDKQITTIPAKPKLIVGIIIDQMRYDYLYKYENKYGANGFKKLMQQGFNCKNNHYNYVPTYTGPGHASVYTGTTPAIHGIIANDWYVRETDKMMYCAQDDNVETVGSSSKKVGKMSPRNMLTTTVTDELKMANNMKSKTIGIALKDRGAILPAGHMANAAYWFDGATGNWVSSTFYMETLPTWVDSFNAKKVYENYLSKPWEPLLPIHQYTESLADDNAYEGKLKGEERPVFPHDLPKLYKEQGAGVIRYTPFGNSFTKDFAVTTIKAEQLGKREVTDFLAVSFSSPDYIGHNWGPHSIEIEDNYLRLDKDLADFISFLETWVGKENLLIFLTADHGGANVPQYLIDHNAPAGIFKSDALVDTAMKYMKALYGNERWILNYENEQFFLNRKLILDKRMNLREMQEKLAEFCLQYKGVSAVYTAHALSNTSFHHLPGELVQMGFHQKRSGDVALVLEPGWMEYSSTGTTHGTVYNYDTHVPLLWYGWKINHGETFQKTHITDIAPTISALLNIPFPNGCIGKPLVDLMCK